MRLNRFSVFCWYLAFCALLAGGCATKSRPSGERSLERRSEANAIDEALKRAGTNRTEIITALMQVSKKRRDGMRFLITNMPTADLQSLSSAFLLENVALAYDAFGKTPWRESIPNEIFLNEILPYASMTETREAWRKKLRETCEPLVQDCKTPAEAAQRLNQKIFKLLKVRYSTDRKRPDQSPSESIQSGVATCTGLSILLADACRSVGVPARVAGTPMWTNMRGNHTWVEIWDGDWHFTGAAEPDPNGLDRGWFTHDASTARRDLPQHAIYATSFKKTDVPFPIVWAPKVYSVSAVNVTDRYAAKSESALDDQPALHTASMACYIRPPVTNPLRSGEQSSLNTALLDFFIAPTNKQENWNFSETLEKLLRENEPAVRLAAWNAFCDAPIHQAVKEDYDAKQVRFDKYLSRYTVKTVGTRPTNGWPLFIAMHGGGGAPKEVNDSQWKVMQGYYKDHPEVGGYLYVALRAPNDTWNGFYDVYVYPLVANLIRQFLLFAEVDPNKVFIMGYSHGGYGAFAIGPKMPDRFAAIHASAAAPTDGETTPKTLRNTIFTYMVGEKDTAYGRIERCRNFNQAIEKLRTDATNSYPVQMQEIAGNGHTGLPDREKIKDMYPNVRNPVPNELTWLMTDKVISDFFWLQVSKPSKKQEINATCRDNRITVTTSTNVTSATVLLDSRLIDFERPVILELNAKTSMQKVQPGLRTLCQTLLRRGDPDLAFTASIDLPLSADKANESSRF